MTELERIFDQLKSSPNGWDISRRAHDDADAPGEVWVSIEAPDFVLLYGVPELLGFGGDGSQARAYFWNTASPLGSVGQMFVDRDNIHISASIKKEFLARNMDIMRDLLEKVDQTKLDDLGISL